MILIILCIFLTTGCQNSDGKYTKTSIINLISNPEKYQNKLVTIIGVGNLEFEENQLCLSKDDLEYHVINNCLWIELNPEISYEVVKKYNGKYVIIEGTFEMKEKGHFEMWAGAIINITRYELWER